MTRFLPLLMVAILAVAGHLLNAADATPGPEPQGQAKVEAVSQAVSAGLAKLKMRVEAAKGADGKVSAAGISDALGRLVKLDDEVQTPADMAAILACAKDLGLVPASTGDYAAMLVIAKGGGAPAAPAATAAPTGSATQAKVEAPSQPEMTWQVGGKARLFVLQPGAKWAAVPADQPPVATIRAPGIPDTTPAWVKRPNIPVAVPNRLIEAAVLDDQAFTATEVSGNYYAEEDGPLSVVVETNGPVVVEFADKPVLTSTWAPPLETWISKGYSHPNVIAVADGKVSVIATGFTPALKKGRYYPVKVTYYQAWRRTARNDANVGWGESMRWSPETDAAGRALEVQGIGARFKLRVVRPEKSEPEVMKLFHQAPKRALRDE